MNSRTPSVCRCLSVSASLTFHAATAMPLSVSACIRSSVLFLALAENPMPYSFRLSRRQRFVGQREQPPHRVFGSVHERIQNARSNEMTTHCSVSPRSSSITASLSGPASLPVLISLTGRIPY